MKLLLDTHALIWWLMNDASLPPTMRAAIGSTENEVIVSAATAWEIGIKYKIGKLPDVAALVADIGGQLTLEGFGELPVSVLHGQLAGALPLHHRDPFDRMLIAQAVTEGLTLVSNETQFDAYGVTRLW